MTIKVWGRVWQIRQLVVGEMVCGQKYLAPLFLLSDCDKVIRLFTIDFRTVAISTASVPTVKCCLLILLPILNTTSDLCRIRFSLTRILIMDLVTLLHHEVSVSNQFSR